MTILFVYGSLKVGHDAHHRLVQEHLMKAESFTMPGQLYLLPEGYPAFTYDRSSDQQVHGELLWLNKTFDFSGVDAWEEYDASQPNSMGYLRSEIDIFHKNTEHRIWLYHFESEQYLPQNSRLIESGRWG